MFSLACNLTKNDVKFFPFEISSKKGTCKQRGLFNHQNYIEKSTWKQQAFFDQQNYTEKSTWKRRGFFDHRNYFKKVRGTTRIFWSRNHIEKVREMTWKFAEIWSSTYRCNIEVEPTRFDGCVRWESFSTFWYSHKIIKSTSDIFSNFLYVGINSSIKSSVFPSCLKTADIRVSTRKGKETWKITIGL